jgi:uncharacterized UBP type Zn finger protein
VDSEKYGILLLYMGFRGLTRLISAAHDQFMEAAKLEQPPVERKEPGAPVGLRNLGATCYVSGRVAVVNNICLSYHLMLEL